MNLLTVHDKPFGQLHQRGFDSGQALCLAALAAGEMRVALVLATVVAQFKMRRSVVQIGLMY